MVLGNCPSSPPLSVCRQVTEHPTLRIYPVHKHPKDLLTCGVVRASCSWCAPTLPIRKIPPLAEAATLQSLKHCNSNLTWKCISTRLQNAPGSPTHHHELHRELSALQRWVCSACQCIREMNGSQVGEGFSLPPSFTFSVTLDFNSQKKRTKRYT